MLGGATGEGGRPGPGRAGCQQISQIQSRSHPGPRVNPISFFKIDHFALLAKEMSTHVVMLLMAYLMLLGTSRK